MDWPCPSMSCIEDSVLLASSPSALQERIGATVSVVRSSGGKAGNSKDPRTGVVVAVDPISKR